MTKTHDKALKSPMLLVILATLALAVGCGHGRGASNFTVTKTNGFETHISPMRIEVGGVTVAGGCDGTEPPPPGSALFDEDIDPCAEARARRNGEISVFGY